MSRSGEPGGGISLVFPPLWYYTSVPSDLTYTGAFLRAQGIPTQVLDLSAGLMRDQLGDHPTWRALRDWDLYRDPDRHLAAVGDLRRRTRQISRRFGVKYRPRKLEFPGLDEASIAGALRVGLDARRNPALATLQRGVDAILAASPQIVAVALGYPAQRVQAVSLARLLRSAGYRGWLVLYGSLEDHIAPDDFADDLVGTPQHQLFDDFDAVITGEAETALLQLYEAATGGRALDTVVNLLSPRTGLERRPERYVEDLSGHPAPDFSGVDPAIYCTPMPVVDLRLGRGCPWGRCAFCAIQSHQVGYRAGPAERVAQAMHTAHRTLGTRFFKIRDDLVTPAQLRELSTAIRRLDFAPRWTARARFQPGLTRGLLADAQSAGLEELWLGLESAVPRVREAMVKGVRQDVVRQNLSDLAAVGIRVRVLCILGFPGETLDEAAATVRFVGDHLEGLTTASVSPFELMRRSPMAQDPDRWGLRLQRDSLPRFARLRFLQPASWADRLDRTTLRALVAEIDGALRDKLAREMLPDAAHGWLSASIRQKGRPE